MSNTNEQSPERLLERFNQKFGRSDEPVATFFAPGRVNLVGEYTDFTGGLVFPCGINQGTTLLIRRTHNNQYRFASTNFDLMAQLEQHEISQTYGDNWINYPLGVLDQFIKRGVSIDGFDCLFSGNVPNGAGLSSSASIEVVTAFAINQIMHTELSLLDLVRVSQSAENDFVGMQCGIMDQFAVAFAQTGHAMMLDCHSVEHRQVPLNLDEHSIVVSNTNQRRELNESAYNNRVSECQRALELLAPATGITHLGQLLPEQLAQHEALFKDDPKPLMRIRHITEENARVRAAVPSLEAGNLQEFGNIMNASHDSLRDLFEVSSEPLNHLVRLAREQTSVLGSRLTGAGFGGCTVSLLPTCDVDAFIATVGPAYTEATGLTADFYTIEPGNGVRAISPVKLP
ncbi:galactokinase [Granulosicoccus antarcticus]|uniref:Galactokinase n=1 Tax=Granulosicoccus antarcticus IMCC3135 TaxID=1192854 RepID=A0A2Z2P6Y2_9GAMM|nr:galactokinase [Granulosicoccus antarcticus]ASJ75614.1 Galactokinase [Granulosicoccus antarcticus IMCC3135]